MLDDVAAAITRATSENKDPARAALSALRTPTPEMIRAAIFVMRHGSRNQMFDDTNIEAIWQAMIDKALGHALRAQHRL